MAWRHGWHQGQVSTYLKPIVLVVLSVLFVVMILVNVNFLSTAEEQRQQFELQAQMQKVRDRIESCLLVSDNASTSEILINKSKLVSIAATNKYQEPTCMEDETYGWNATITQEFLTGTRSEKKKGGASIMLIIDGSGSMQNKNPNTGELKIKEVKKAAKNFVEETGDTDLVGALQFSQSVRMIHELSKDTTSVKNAIDSFAPLGDGTAIQDGIRRANQGLKNNGKGKRYAIVLTDGCPSQKPAGGNFQDEVERAKELNIRIFTIGFALGTGGSTLPGCTKQVAKNNIETIAQETGGQSFMAKNLEDLKEIYEFIASQVQSKKGEFGLTGTTCTLVPKKGIKGSVDIAFVVDSSRSIAGRQPCNKIDKIVGQLQKAGLDVKHTTYELPEGPDISKWVSNHDDLNFGGSLGQKHWAYYYAGPVQCASKTTKWPDDFVLNPFKDAQAEGWAAGVDYVFDEHKWTPFAHNLVIVIGDHDPTGGCSGRFYDDWKRRRGGGFATADFSSPESYSANRTAHLDVNCENDYGELNEDEGYFLNPWRAHPYQSIPGDEKGTVNTEVEAMERVVSKANEEQVPVYFLRGSENVMKKQYKAGNDQKLDFVESMRRVARKTNGRVFTLAETGALISHFKDRFTTFDIVQNVNTCNNVKYSFGEQEGSFANSRDGQLQMSFPVSIKHNEKLTTPGTMTVEVRNGPLERLSGAINRVHRIAQREGNTSSVVQIDTNSQMRIEPHTFTRPQEVKYTLSGGVSPTDSIFVDEDITVGVDGDKVFEDDDRTATTNSSAQYTGAPISFRSRKGRSFQVLGFNFNEPTLGIGPLYLHCCNGQIQQFDQRVYADKNTNPEKYKNLSDQFNFYFNYTTIDIGKMKSYTESALCMGTSNKHCVNLKPNTINNMTLPAGKHFVRIRADNSSVTVTRRGANG